MVDLRREDRVFVFLVEEVKYDAAITRSLSCMSISVMTKRREPGTIQHHMQPNNDHTIIQRSVHVSSRASKLCLDRRALR